MNILGFQKMTLLDFPGKVACTVFTGGCNLRCPFCHNAPLVTRINPDDRYDPEEILRFLATRTGLLDGVAVTGGEPLLQPDIAGFLRRVKALGFLVKLDTNGSFPDKLEDLLSDGLVDYAAVDVKNSRAKYAETVGVPGYDPAPLERSLAVLRGGTIPYELRSTVVRELHTVEDIAELARWIAGAPNYFLQNFVDSGDLIGGGLHPVSAETLRAMAAAAAPFVGRCEVRGI